MMRIPVIDLPESKPKIIDMIAEGLTDIMAIYMTLKRTHRFCEHFICNDLFQDCVG